jgi:tetratricopeptide (TPR) repeat protein
MDGDMVNIIAANQSSGPQHVGRMDVMRDAYEQLHEAEELRQSAKLDQAIRICEKLVRNHPEYWGAFHTLGLIFSDQKQYQRALDCLVRAQMLNPTNRSTVVALSSVYLSMGVPQMAAQTLMLTRSAAPDDANIHYLLGEIYRAELEFEKAIGSYRQALKLDPNMHSAVMGLGRCFVSLENYASAVEVFESLVHSQLRIIDPLHELATLPASFIKLDILAEMAKVAKEPLQDQAEFENACAFTKAIVLHNAGRHNEAWRCIVPANTILFRAKCDEFQELSWVQRNALASMRAFVGKYPPAKNSADRPISLLILGPSRSGKTTLERLISTLNCVKRTFESPIAGLAVRNTLLDAGLLPSQFLEFLPPELHQQYVESYFTDLQKKFGAVKVISNTNPVLVRDAARMAAVVPNVRIILVKRNIEDNVFRMYMTEYQNGNSYAYDLKAARDHIDWYNEMMDLIAATYPDLVRAVTYEEMVDDPLAVRNLVANLCGIEPGPSTILDIGDDRGCAAPYEELMAAEQAK